MDCVGKLLGHEMRTSSSSLLEAKLTEVDEEAGTGDTFIHRHLRSRKQEQAVGYHLVNPSTAIAIRR